MVKAPEVEVPVTLEIKPECPLGCFLGFIFAVLGFCIAGIVGVFTVGFLKTICLAVFCGILSGALGLTIGDLWTIITRRKQDDKR